MNIAHVLNTVVATSAAGDLCADQTEPNAFAGLLAVNRAGGSDESGSGQDTSITALPGQATKGEKATGKLPAPSRIRSAKPLPEDRQSEGDPTTFSRILELPIARAVQRLEASPLNAPPQSDGQSDGQSDVDRVGNGAGSMPNQTTPVEAADLGRAPNAITSNDCSADYVEVVDAGTESAATELAARTQTRPANYSGTLLAPAMQQVLQSLAQSEPSAGPRPLAEPGRPEAATPQPAMVQPSLSQQIAPHAVPSNETTSATPTRHQAAAVLNDVTVEVVRAARAGKREVSVRLDPPELGKVEIRWSVDEAGKVRTVVAADNPATLELLRRDSSQLARALNSAGVAADTGAFSFDLRQDSGASGGQQRQAAFHQRASRDDSGFDAAVAAPSRLPSPRRPSALGRIDLVI